VITIERLKAPTVYNYQNFEMPKGASSSERVKRKVLMNIDPEMLSYRVMGL